MKYFIPLFLFLAGCASPNPGPTITRKAVLTKGQQFELSAVVTTEFETQDETETKKTSDNIVQITSINVGEVMDKTYLLNSRINKKTQKFQSGNESFIYDSDKPADTTEAFLWNKFIDGVGQLVQVVVDMEGNTISRNGTAVVFDNLGLSGILQDGSHAVSKTYDLFAELPLQAIGVGDSWTDSKTSKNVREENHYTLKFLTATEGLIAVNTKLVIESERLVGTDKVVLKLKGTSNGNIKFDPATGIMKSKESKADASGTFTIFRVAVPMAYKNKSSMTIKQQ